MRVFFDSSAFVKRFVQEVGSEQADMACTAASALGLSVICVPEMLSALNRKVREGVLLQADYSELKQAIAQDIADAQIVNLGTDVLRHTVVLLEQNTLRSLDAMHIACALEWGAERFVSADKRQLKAAQNAGLSVQFIQGM